MEVRSECESSDKFSQAKELLRERYISKDEDEVWCPHSGSHLTGSSSSPSIFLEESGPSCFAKRIYDSILLSSMISLCAKLYVIEITFVMLKFLLKFLIRLFFTVLLLTFVLLY